MGSVPKPVKDFIAKIKIDQNAFVFSVCTCGDSADYALKILERYIRLDSGYSIIMPNNHITLVNSDSNQVIKNKVSNAKIKISFICENIKSRKKEIQYDKGVISFLKSYVIAPIITSRLNDKKFHVEDSCIGCKLCEKTCPVQNIKVINGTPAWHHNCIHCMACLHNCPPKAIQYGKVTQNRGRFIMKNNLDI